MATQRTGGVAMGASDVVSAIQSRIASGTLPARRATPLWAGRSPGGLCDGCGEPITSLEPECEFQWARGVIRFHSACLSAWEVAAALMSSKDSVGMR